MITLDAPTPDTNRSRYFGFTEQYKTIVDALCTAADQPGVGVTIGITSCAHHTGVSTVAGQLAAAAADYTQRPVLLLDLTGTSSSIAAGMETGQDVGLADALDAGDDASQHVRPSGIDHLSFLGHNGSTTETPVKRRVCALLQVLRREFAVIVVDLPPIESGLCLTLAPELTGVLIVVEAYRTNRHMASRAAQRLSHTNATIMGAILNKAS